MSYEDLARRMDVMPSAIHEWLSGQALPAANRLLKMSFILNMSFDDMLVSAISKAPEPIVAYRKKAQKKTTEAELELARTKGRLLRPLVKYMTNRHVNPATFRTPSISYDYIQQAASDLRRSIGLTEESVIGYSNLISKFNELGAVIVPVLWGERDKHGNALHILLPDTNATWIYLNLDANVCDFNFWMAHELAHVYTRELAGTDAGEDFSDAFAGAVLFPRTCAEKLYAQLSGKPDGLVVNMMKAAAKERLISPYTVFLAINNYANSRSLRAFQLNIFGAMKNFEKEFPSITQVMFQGSIPDANKYIETVRAAFLTPFFDLASKYLQDSAQGPGWLAEVLEISILDAKELYVALGGEVF